MAILLSQLLFRLASEVSSLFGALDLKVWSLREGRGGERTLKYETELFKPFLSNFRKTRVCVRLVRAPFSNKEGEMFIGVFPIFHHSRVDTR